MKNFTLKNHERATKLIMKKGYNREEAENIAINAFAMYAAFKDYFYCVEDVIHEKVSDKAED